MDPIPQTEEEWMFHGVLCGDPIATFKLRGGQGRRRQWWRIEHLQQ